jgi:hypothetical protein
MEHLRIRKISESDFDSVIKAAGGSRIEEPDSADYILNEALVELKFVEEEGFHVPTRQKKIAEIFRQQQPNSSVVVIRPKSLDKINQQVYYNALARPVESHVRKAAEQLETTALRFNPQPVRVLVILNTGYTALLPDEFKEICVRCVHKENYSDRIDWLVCGGIYFMTNGYDNWTISNFEEIPINLSRGFPIAEKLRDAWHGFVSRMLKQICSEFVPEHEAKVPIGDLAFEIDGVRYIKPSPKTPKSGFWPGGYAPRKKVEEVFHNFVAITFPALSEENWKFFKKAMPTEAHLQFSYKEWLDFLQQEDENLNNPLEPFVPVSVQFDKFAEWVKKPICDWVFSDICKFSNEVFHRRGLEILQRAKEKEQITVITPESIQLVVGQIGQDEANDLSSIYYVSEVPGFERKEAIIENENLHFNQSISLATAYAIKRNVEILIHSKRRL